MIVIKRDKYPGKQGFPGYFCHISGDRMRVLFWETGMLVTALSADAFAAGLAYGAEDIRLPAVSLLTASAVSSLILAVSLLTGGLAGGILPAGLVKGSGFLILAVLGVWKLCERPSGKSAAEADKNRDRLVSPAEALALGAALSADSLAAGIGAGALNIPLLPAAAASFLAGAAALSGGERLGRVFAASEAESEKTGAGSRLKINRLGGILLLLLAAAKLL